MFNSVSYLNSKSFTERREDYLRIKSKYPDYIPIIINSTQIELRKHKFLISGDMQMGQLLYAIRKQTQLQPQEAIFVYVNNTLVPINKMVHDLWENYHNEDGFIYLTICKENTFG